MTIIKQTAIYLSLLIGGGLIAEAWGQWSRDPDHAIEFGGGPLWAVHLVSDSLGGVFIHAAGGFRTYCYYIDSNGFRRWNEWVEISPLATSSPPPGFVICPERGYVVALSYSVWHSENGDTSWDIRAHKLNSEGEFVWSDSGVSVSNIRLRHEDNADFSVIGMESDGEGGIIVVWVVKYYNDDGYVVRQPFLAQKISPDGQLLWNEEGVEIVNEDSISSQGLCVSDNDGGIIILYNILNNPYTQRISNDGNKIWGQAGMHYELDFPLWLGSAVPDGHNGVIFSGCEHIGARRTVRVFRFNEEGQQLWGDGNGIIVRDVDYHNGGVSDPKLVQVSDSVYFVTWRENLPHRIVQAVSQKGNLIWHLPGMTICDADSQGFDLSGIKSDRSAIYAWRSYRPNEERDGAIYCQRLNMAGNRLWDDEGIILLNRERVSPTDVITDCSGGAIFFIGSSFLQQINRNGELGIPLSVPDIEESTRKSSAIFSLYPNPSNSHFRFYFNGIAPNEIYNYSIYNMMGRSVLNGRVKGASFIVKDLSPFPCGEYILQIQSPRRTLAGRIVLVK